MVHPDKMIRGGEASAQASTRRAMHDSHVSHVVVLYSPNEWSRDCFTAHPAQCPSPGPGTLFRDGRIGAVGGLLSIEGIDALGVLVGLLLSIACSTSEHDGKEDEDLERASQWTDMTERGVRTSQKELRAR